MKNEVNLYRIYSLCVNFRSRICIGIRTTRGKFYSPSSFSVRRWINFHSSTNLTSITNHHRERERILSRSTDGSPRTDKFITRWPAVTVEPVSPKRSRITGLSVDEIPWMREIEDTPFTCEGWIRSGTRRSRKFTLRDRLPVISSEPSKNSSGWRGVEVYNTRHHHDANGPPPIYFPESRERSSSWMHKHPVCARARVCVYP